MTEETKEDAKVVVRPDTTEYVKARSASGAKSMHNGDAVATALEGATLDEVYALTSEATETSGADLHTKYGHLNDGMQRMNLGNRLRGVVNKMNKEKDGSGDKWMAQVSSGLRQSVEKRQKEVAKAKADAAKEKAAAEKSKPKTKAKKAA